MECKNEAHLPAESLVGNESIRPKWRNKQEFLLTLVGYAVGIGNVWRFPYLCFDNGGASFLIPYLLTLLFLGVPIFGLELAVGQRFRMNTMSVWPSMSPYLGGVGVASVLTTFYVSIYYNVILAWALVYLGASFVNPLPWSEKTAHGGNVTTMDPDIYFHETVLEVSEGISDMGGVPWRLGVALTIAWLLVYGIIYNGIESSGRVVYFTSIFPYLVLTIMVLRGVTLPGASDGLRYYLVPSWSKLLEAEVWAKAANQVFFSLGIGWGTHVMYASYNPSDHNFLETMYLVPAINAATSFFAGFAVFGTLGFLAHQTGVPVEELSAGGFGLAFEAYPAALNEMKSGGNALSALFFFMLVLLAIDSQFALTETVVTALIESKILEDLEVVGYGGRWWQGGRSAADHKQAITAAVCVVSWLLGFLCVCRGGLYWVKVLDGLAVGFTLFAVAGMEAFAVSYVVGADRFLDECRAMVGPAVSRRYSWTLNYYLRFCWTVASPLLCSVLVCATFAIMVTSNHEGLVCAGRRDASTTTARGEEDKEEQKRQEQQQNQACRKSHWGIGVGIALCLLATSAIPLAAMRTWWVRWRASGGGGGDNDIDTDDSVSSPPDDVSANHHVIERGGGGGGGDSLFRQEAADGDRCGVRGVDNKAKMVELELPGNAIGQNRGKMSPQIGEFK